MKLIINEKKIKFKLTKNVTDLSCDKYVPPGESKIIWCLLCEDGCNSGKLSMSTGTCRHTSTIKFCLKKFTIL